MNYLSNPFPFTVEKTVEETVEKTVEETGEKTGEKKWGVWSANKYHHRRVGENVGESVGENLKFVKSAIFIDIIRDSRIANRVTNFNPWMIIWISGSILFFSSFNSRIFFNTLFA